MKVKIVTKSGCQYCVLAKARLTKEGLDFTEQIADDDDERAAFYTEYCVNTVPQIFIGGKRIGGYTDLLAFLQKPTLRDESVTYKPFRYPWAVEITKRHEKVHWIEDEIDLTEDVTQWKRNTDPVEKSFITNILRLFTQSDVAVGKNYCEQFIPVFKNNEVRIMLTSIAAREGTHQRAYAALNDTLGLPDTEYSAFLEYKEMSDKIDFMTQSDVNTDTGMAMALVKSVFNEGVSLMASFVMLLHFQRDGKMKGMGKVVEWSVRDETIHVEAITALLNTFLVENPTVLTPEFENTVYDMARQVVNLETKFIDLAYSAGPVKGLKREDVTQYIRHITDRRLLQIGFNPIFGEKDHELPWVDYILNGADHTNFFENRVTEYEIAGLTGSWETAYDDYQEDGRESAADQDGGYDCVRQ